MGRCFSSIENSGFFRLRLTGMLAWLFRSVVSPNVNKLKALSENFFCSMKRRLLPRRRFGLGNEGQPRHANVEIKFGNILEATEDYIAHQCNCCLHNRAIEGLAQGIFSKFPHANPYAKRDLDPKLIDKPGTADVAKPVVNLYAQFAPGKPRNLDDVPGSKWERQFVTAKDAGLLDFNAADSTEERIGWFRQCLKGLPEQCRGRASIAFPSGIGCGLAGGRWEEYLAAIKEFAAANPMIHVVIYEFKKSD